MLSILIPTYNYNIFTLASALHKQCTEAKIVFEIIIVDDASKTCVKENLAVKELKNTKLVTLQKNSGRSFVRNHLASLAKYENLLFLDADTLPIQQNFILKYIEEIELGFEVVYGGISYSESRPKRNKILRWTYGRRRESIDAKFRKESPYISFLTLNFVIKKTIIKHCPFNETIPNLRHEDTLFSYNLREKEIDIRHIENPVWHLGLENNKTFLKKSEESVLALHHLILKKLIDTSYTKLSRTVVKVKKLKLEWLCLFFYYLFKKPIRANLLSKKPMLVLMDFYRLGYYLNLCKKE